MTHLSEEDLILIYYGEAPPSKHLAECPQCSAAAAALASTLDTCNGWTVPQGPPELERSVWAQIAPALEPRRRYVWRWPILAAAFATLLIAAFVLGRVTTRPTQQPVIMAGLSAEARARILRISLADHLDRADMLLTEIANASDLNAAERSRAQDLVGEGRLMRQALNSHRDTGTLALMDEVERFMLEVSNSSFTVGELQSRMSSRSLLFKVRIIESNLRSQGKQS